MTKEQVTHLLNTHGIDNLIGLEYDGNIRSLVNRYDFYFDLTNEVIVERVKSTQSDPEPYLQNSVRIRQIATMYTMYFKNTIDTTAYDFTTGYTQT